MQELEDPRKALGGPGTLTLFLSLYLLVLAFFILLNSVAEFEAIKTKAAVQSLSSTFAASGPAGREEPFVANYGDLQSARAFQAEMGRVFQAAIPAARVEVLRPGRLMQVDFPAEALFMPDSAQMRPGQFPLLDRLVAALSAPPAGLRHEIEFAIGSIAGPGNALPIGETAQVARVGAFARAMVARGLAPDALLVGTMAGDPGRATVLFRTVSADEARPRFGQVP